MLNRKEVLAAAPAILIVEDELIVAMDIAESIRSLGYNVPGIASSSEEAIRYTLEKNPDLILMDIRIKGAIDGIETARKINSFADIPVIYLTAFADDETLHRAKTTQPFGYILKPYDKKSLHTTIEMALYKHNMEKRVKESERWLATTLNSMGDAMIATNPSGEIIFMNPVAEFLTGWQQSEAMRKNITEVVNIMEGPQPGKMINPVELVRQAQDRVYLNGAISLINHDGKHLAILGTASPLMDDQNKLSGFVLVFQDITEQKMIENERERLLSVTKQRVAELDAVLESIPDAVYIGDKTGIKKANKPALSFLQFKKKSKKFSKDPEKLISETDIEEGSLPKEDVFARALEGEISTREVILKSSSTGDKSYFRSAAAPIVLDGKIIGAVTINTDITSSKKAEEELKLSEERFAKAFQASPHPAFISRVSDGQIIEINDTWENLFEYCREEVESLHLKAFDVFNDSQLGHKTREWLTENVNIRGYETEIKRKSGEIRQVTLSIENIVLNGESHLLCILNDITEDKRAEKEREQLFKKVSAAQERLKILSSRLMEVQEIERRSLARELHDEIGQILTAIKINLQMSSQFIKSPDAESHMQASIELTEEALKQVRSLSLDLRPSMLDDLGLIPALRWYVDRQSQRTGINARLVTESVNGRLSPHLEIACYRITQEALTNVIRHAGVDVSVDVELWREENQLHLKITDNGKGFDVYAALQRSVNGKSMGIIGMQERVELLGGTLKINSRAGKGTEIHAIFILDQNH